MSQKFSSLAEEGRLRTEWAEMHMPVLRLIRERFEKEKPLKGVKIGACLHVTTETANLMKTLVAGGAEVALCASNPLSTKDDVVAHLVEHEKMKVYARYGESREEYYEHIDKVLDIGPNITLDDGADLISTIHAKRQDLIANIYGGVEETTTGVIRLRNMAEKGVLKYPIIAANDAATKHLFDNRYGTGQNTLDGIMRATNILIAGKIFVVCGYGWCGRGVAMRAHGMGANVVVIEVDPIKALEAVMDGFRVMPIAEAARLGDIFVTVTGNKWAINKEHIATMKDGAILANNGHFDVEIDVVRLKEMALSQRRIRQHVVEYTLPSGNRIYLLAEGRLVGQTAAEAHPAEIMDMSFAIQALAAEYLLKEPGSLENKVYLIPQEVDHSIARLKLKSMGIEMDELTDEQKEYLSSWTVGT
ncbi:adenosylhomocysteinase [Candidatus Hakubella thermalkaliphila]|uniref:Adenosylhomocysteinase n=4 Tax=Candidatus Hakubella thermalkaliphila TaxID=2754717 RepID=A0A6V8NS44_9ACTN|nr:adenosylhomocysteinase [Candidatus Hakubella thermalkaliphila]GFP21266.1 adenosylhomocysteinase [Candidatus Hakubella thermalkaliphila]